MPIRPNQDAGNANEPEAIRNMYKNQIYAQLSNQYLLPSLNSKGVNRGYVVGVYSGNFFRVAVLEIKRFEAELTPEQTVKAPIMKYNEILHKVTRLLVEFNQPPLGFAEGACPEEAWLMRIARYIDRQNLSGIFTLSIPNAPQIDSLSQRMRIAKENALNFLLGGLNNNLVYKDVMKLWESQKRLTAETGKRRFDSAAAEYRSKDW